MLKFGMWSDADISKCEKVCRTFGPVSKKNHRSEAYLASPTFFNHRLIIFRNTLVLCHAERSFWGCQIYSARQNRRTVTGVWQAFKNLISMSFLCFSFRDNTDFTAGASAGFFKSLSVVTAFLCGIEELWVWTADFFNLLELLLLLCSMQRVQVIPDSGSYLSQGNSSSHFGLNDRSGRFSL